MSPMRGLRWIMSVVLLASVLAVLWHAGDGLLRPPPLSISGAQAWLAQRDPLLASFALVRIGLLTVGSYLVLVLVVAALTHVASGAQRSRFVLDRLSFGLARGLLSTLGLTTVVVGAGPTAHAQAPPSSTAIIHAIGSAPSSPTQATIHALPAGTSIATSTTTMTTTSTTAPRRNRCPHQRRPPRLAHPHRRPPRPRPTRSSTSSLPATASGALLLLG